MSTFYHYLVEVRSKEELAKEVVKLAKERAVLQDRVSQLEHELFWIKNQGGTK